MSTAFQTEAIHCTGRDNTLADIPCASVPNVRLGGFPPAAVSLEYSSLRPEHSPDRYCHQDVYKRQEDARAVADLVEQKFPKLNGKV